MNKRKTGTLAILALGALLLFASCTSTVESAPDLSNKEKALALVNSFQNGNDHAVMNYVSEDYIQHNLTFPDGRQAIAEALPALAASGTTVENIRIFEDGDTVVLHSRYNLFGGGEQVGFDVFRFEDGMIVEHWDNLLATREPNPSGHTQTDGPVMVSDLEKTEENKALVTNFFHDVLMGENPAALPTYFEGNAYIQHNPDIADTVEGLGSALQAMASMGVSMVFDTIHQVHGSGNFVLVMSEGTYGTADNPIPTSYYDLFRIENGKIAEHWDVMAPITQTPNPMNPNGKF